MFFSNYKLHFLFALISVHSCAIAKQGGEDEHVLIENPSTRTEINAHGDDFAILDTVDHEPVLLENPIKQAEIDVHGNDFEIQYSNKPLWQKLFAHNDKPSEISPETQATLDAMHELNPVAVDSALTIARQLAYGNSDYVNIAPTDRPLLVYTPACQHTCCTISATPGAVIKALEVAACIYRGTRDAFHTGSISLLKGVSLAHRLKALNLALPRISSHCKQLKTDTNLGMDCDGLFQGKEHVLFVPYGLPHEPSISNVIVRGEEHGVNDWHSFAHHGQGYIESQIRKVDPLRILLNMYPDDHNSFRKERTSRKNAITTLPPDQVDTETMQAIVNGGMKQGTFKMAQELDKLAATNPALKSPIKDWSTQLSEELGGDTAQRIGREVQLDEKILASAHASLRSELNVARYDVHQQCPLKKKYAALDGVSLSKLTTRAYHLAGLWRR